MKKTLTLVAALAIAASTLRADGTFYGDNVFTTPGTFTIQSGVNLTGTWNFTNATVQGLNITAGPGGLNGELQWNNSGVLNGLSTLITDGSDITTPASRFYFEDTSDTTKKIRFNASTLSTGQSVQVNVGGNSTTVISDTGATNNFLTGIGSTGGITKARPTIANLTDLTGTSRLIGSNASTAAVGEILVGNNLSIDGSNHLNATTGGVADGDKGDISVSNGGTTWTVDYQAITYPKIQNVTQNRILGRVSSGSGQIEELTGTQAETLLPVFSDTTAGLVPASGGGTSMFLRADHTFATPAGGGTVTTTGTPYVNSLSIFSGSTSITNLHNALGTAGFIKIGTDDLFTLENASTFRTSIGAGTVYNFSAGDLSPLFTTTETNTTTSPALTFNLTSAPAHNYFGNNTGSSGAPAYHQINFSELAGTIGLSQFYINTGRLLGRTDAGTGGIAEISVTSPLNLANGTITLNDGGISNAKLRDSAALSVIGRSVNSSGDPADITTTSSSNAVLRESGGTLGFGTIASGAIADRAVTLAKMPAATGNSKFLGSGVSGSGASFSEMNIGKNLRVTSNTDVDAGYYATGENQTGFASDTYINGSRITIPAGALTVGMVYHCTFTMSKTAAGTGQLAYAVRVGTTGTVSDFGAVPFAFGLNGTASADTGTFELWAYVRSSGASTVMVGSTRISKNQSSQGLMNTGPAQYVVNVAGVVGSSFNSATATKIGVSFYGDTNFNGTLGIVQAELIEP